MSWTRRELYDLFFVDAWPADGMPELVAEADEVHWRRVSSPWAEHDCFTEPLVEELFFDHTHQVVEMIATRCRMIALKDQGYAIRRTANDPPAPGKPIDKDGDAQVSTRYKAQILALDRSWVEGYVVLSFALW